MKNITEEMGIKVPTPLYWYWKITWCFLTPVFLVVSNEYLFHIKFKTKLHVF